MKKIVSASIAVALLSGSFGAVAAGVDRKLSLVGADFYYDPAATYNELGTELDPLDPENDGKILIDGDDNGFDDVTGKSMTFATFRDNGPTGGTSGLNDGDNDGKGDATFGDLTYADPLESITVLEESDPIGSPGVFDKQILTYTTDPIALDFRIVLEQGEEVTGAGEYQIEEKYSFFDILTQDGVKDWGLALDASSQSASTLVVSEFGGGGGLELTIVFAGLAGELFDDPEGNNLPFDTVDPNSDITFSFTFQNQTLYDWSLPVEASGDGNVLYTSVPEPGSLGLIGLALAGFGVMQRRRKQK
ncbi:PEP-CTERM sorting domain-containing protein (plasmid) [Vibrio alfacsensis]|uniref:PEP-CTERM sorting domain-containing protein n=1 Tax=Vibrio alfacsensis TaxID=1074311 RepID=UPI002ADE7A23|nr:PEP-CTERM sorting domain-containing protein [Vibrio alfacsensis]WQE79145.1 PEP-CTERM sorting domain-containing protein [Vibrio alfacsensis]